MRVGTTVRRPTYPFSPSVHALLRFLEAAGFDGSPRFRGVDDRGAEVLSYIDGVAGRDGWAKVLPDLGLRSVAGLLRRYHDAVRPFRPADDCTWSSGARGAGGVVLHGDPGPWNVVWRDGEAVALIDWDHANPGDPLDDLAYLAAYAAPLCSDHVAMTWMRHPGPPDRRHRLQVLADGYGTAADGLVDRAVQVLAKTNRTVDRMAAAGLEPQRSWVESGRVRQLWKSQEQWIVAHRDELT